jgi:hypothetical protein
MTGNFNHIKRVTAAFEEICIRLLIAAYQKALLLKEIKLDWMENDITIKLHEYIEDNPTRKTNCIATHVESHLPDKSIPEERGFADKYSRIDMCFTVFHKYEEYKYFAEAKIVKEKDGKLKRRYIATGIDNFVSGKYKNGCLIVYLLEGDLKNTVESVNDLLVKDGRVSEILTKREYQFFNQYYESQHKSIDILKHFMFDFTVRSIQWKNLLNE